MHYIVNHSTVTPEQFAAMQADQAAIIEALDEIAQWGDGEASSCEEPSSALKARAALAMLSTVNRLATPSEVEAIRLARLWDPSLQNDPRFLRWFLRNESLFQP